MHKVVAVAVLVCTVDSTVGIALLALFRGAIDFDAKLGEVLVIFCGCHRRRPSGRVLQAGAPTRRELVLMLLLVAPS
jgi:hypothetical protein